MSEEKWISTKVAVPREGVMVMVRTSVGEETAGFASWFDFIIHDGKIIKVAPYPDGWQIRLRDLEIPKGAVVEWREIGEADAIPSRIRTGRAKNMRGLGAAILEAMKTIGAPALTDSITEEVSKHFNMDRGDLHRRVVQQVHLLGKRGYIVKAKSRGRGHLWSIPDA